MANADLAGPLHKGKTRKQLKQARARLQAKVEHVENEKVVERSGGRCEVGGPRCRSFAEHIHHVLWGRGVRGRGASALASNKVAVCRECHADIHGHKLEPGVS
jgi:hypothetical protein